MSQFGADIFDDEPPRKPPRRRTRKPADATAATPLTEVKPASPPEPSAPPASAAAPGPATRAPTRRPRRIHADAEDVVFPSKTASAKANAAAAEPPVTPLAPTEPESTDQKPQQAPRRTRRNEAATRAPEREPTPEPKAGPTDSTATSRPAAPTWPKTPSWNSDPTPTPATDDRTTSRDDEASRDDHPLDSEPTRSEDRGANRHGRRGRRGASRQEDERAPHSAHDTSAAPADPTDTLDAIRPTRGPSTSAPASESAAPRSQAPRDAQTPPGREQPREHGRDRGRTHGPHHDRGPRRDGRDARPFRDEDEDYGQQPRPALPVHRGGRPAPTMPPPAPQKRIGLLVDLGVLMAQVRSQGGELAFRKLRGELAAGDEVLHAICLVPTEASESCRSALRSTGFELHSYERAEDGRTALLDLARSTDWSVEVLVLAGAPTDADLSSAQTGSRAVALAGFGAIASSATSSGASVRMLGKNCMFVP